MKKNKIQPFPGVPTLSEDEEMVCTPLGCTIKKKQSNDEQKIQILSTLQQAGDTAEGQG